MQAKIAYGNVWRINALRRTLIYNYLCFTMRAHASMSCRRGTLGIAACEIDTDTFFASSFRTPCIETRTFRHAIAEPLCDILDNDRRQLKPAHLSAFLALRPLVASCFELCFTSLRERGQLVDLFRFVDRHRQLTGGPAL